MKPCDPYTRRLHYVNVLAKTRERERKRDGDGNGNENGDDKNWDPLHFAFLNGCFFFLPNLHFLNFKLSFCENGRLRCRKMNCMLHSYNWT